MSTNLIETGNSFGLSFLVERIVAQIEGRDEDYELREEVLDKGIQYFESAKNGLLDVKSEVCGGNWRENLSTFNHLMEVGPDLQELGTMEALVTRLDEYVKCLRTLKSGKGQIPEEVKQQLLGFYKKLLDYEKVNRSNLSVYSDD